MCLRSSKPYWCFKDVNNFKDLWELWLNWPKEKWRWSMRYKKLKYFWAISVVPLPESLNTTSSTQSSTSPLQIVKNNTEAPSNAEPNPPHHINYYSNSVSKQTLTTAIPLESPISRTLYECTTIIGRASMEGRPWDCGREKIYEFKLEDSYIMHHSPGQQRKIVVLQTLQVDQASEKISS